MPSLYAQLLALREAVEALGDPVLLDSVDAMFLADYLTTINILSEGIQDVVCWIQASNLDAVAVLDELASLDALIHVLTGEP